MEDAARGIVDAMERYDKPDPVNLGTGKEITIRNLVSLIKDLVGFEGTVEWDTAKPGGQSRRCLEVTRAEREFDWIADTELAKGLKQTVKWYEER